MSLEARPVVGCRLTSESTTSPFCFPDLIELSRSTLRDKKSDTSKDSLIGLMCLFARRTLHCPSACVTALSDLLYY